MRVRLNVAPWVGLALAAGLSACEEAPSAKGLAAGEARLSRPAGQGDDAQGPKAYSGSAGIACRLEYPGPLKKIEWRTEVWARGKVVTVGKWSTEVWRPPGADVRFTLADSRGAQTTIVIEGEFEFSDASGGSTTVGGKKQELHPGSKHIVTVSRLPKDPLTFSDGDELVLWEVLAGQDPIAPPANATLESAAAEANWALLLRLRFSP